MIYGIIVKISEVLLRIKYDEIDKINELIEQFVDSVYETLRKIFFELFLTEKCVDIVNYT